MELSDQLCAPASLLPVLIRLQVGWDPELAWTQWGMKVAVHIADRSPVFLPIRKCPWGGCWLSQFLYDTFRQTSWILLRFSWFVRSIEGQTLAVRHRSSFASSDSSSRNISYHIRLMTVLEVKWAIMSGYSLM